MNGRIKATVLTVAPLGTVWESVRAELARKFGLHLEVKLYFLQEGKEEHIDRQRLRGDLEAADYVLLDLMGAADWLASFICSVLGQTANAVIPASFAADEVRRVTRLASFSLQEVLACMRTDGHEETKKMPPASNAMIMDAAELVERFKGLLPPQKRKDASNWAQVYRYWSNGGAENLKNMWLFLAENYHGMAISAAGPPLDAAEKGVYHPLSGKTYDRLEDYLADYPLDEQKPTVGMIFYLGRYGEASRAGVDALVERLEPFCNVVPVFFSSAAGQRLEVLERFFYRHGRPLVDAIINLTAFRLNVGPRGGDPGPTVEQLKRLDVPVFHPIPMNKREIREWEQADSLSPVEIIIHVILPELDGCIEPIPVSGLQSQGYSQELGLELKEAVPIAARADRIANRVLSWLRLRRKANADKKVALILYNYPPGEDSIGGAAYLDVFASIKKLLEEMKQAGYTTGELPDGKLHELFLERGLVNSGRWTALEKTAVSSVTVDRNSYESMFGQFPAREKVIAEWGPPPGEIMADGKRLVLPGLFLGNIFIGLQPSRGCHEKPEKAYHDKRIPPHHQYIAFYKWLEEVWGADACVHVGTHGTLEFTNGKEVGMSGNCFPDFLIGRMPHLYIYHVGNPSEAMIAKRRSMAVLANYNSPPLAASGLYDELAELEMLIDEYHEAGLHDVLRRERVREAIMEKARRANFAGLEIAEIHDELFRIKRSLIPKGLHILDSCYGEDEIADFVAFVLRYDRGEARSLNRILCSLEGIEYDEAIRRPAGYAKVLSRIDFKARELVKRSLQTSIEEAIAGLDAGQEDLNEIKTALAFGHKVARDLRQQGEISAILEGLEGKYIMPNVGGDTVRTPEALPTGRNTYQFDPRLVPTEAAYARGAEIADNTISFYYQQHGAYPQCAAVVLWGFETAKSQGETVGQVLRYLGLKAVRKKSAWVPQLEVIPLEELGRPRIDVVVNMCGFFRDLFPNVLELLVEAFDLVASLDEPPEMNYVRQSAEKLCRELQEKAVDLETARQMSRGRVFGPPAGEYGTRVRGLIETRYWTDEGQLADAYIQSMNHLYTKGIRAGRTDELFRRQLGRVELISQVRSSHDYEITDLDHYYEYFGGLAKSVELAAGRKPEMLFSDTTREAIITEDVSAAIKRGVRTRLLNPKWIEGLLGHDYHGVQHIADRVENLLGLAATTNRVDNWIWSKVAERYVFDEEMRKRLQDNNCWAAAEIIDRLLEANKRGYWSAGDQELEKLREARLEMEGTIEDKL